MIELRWLTRRKQGMMPGVVEHVLQFRQQELLFPAMNIIEFQEGNRWQWTDWQDVPAVAE